MEGKAIGNICCMNVCLSTVWSATAFWFTCMPLSNGPDTPLLTECFYFWCFTVTSQRKYQSRCICHNLFVNQLLVKNHYYQLKAWTSFPYNSILIWTLKNLLTSNCIENNLFKKFNFYCIYTSLHISLAFGQSHPCSFLHCIKVSIVGGGSPTLFRFLSVKLSVDQSGACSGYFSTFCQDRLASGSPACRLVSAQLVPH